MSDLTERLADNCWHHNVGCICDEAKTALTEQAAEIDRLREALKPFSIALDIAENALGWADIGHIDAVAMRYIHHAHMTAARAALGEKP